MSSEPTAVPPEVSRKPRWAVDGSWTGDWELPPVLLQPPPPTDRAALVALSMGGLGPAGLVREIARAGSIGEALAQHPGGPDPEVALERVTRIGARIITPADAEYPEPLRWIDAPPPILYVRGRGLDELSPCVSVVGSRACTRGAARFARRLGEAFARTGFTVVSGLARGIDAAAHQGALDAGCTIAVLGTGIDRVYPAEHRKMAERMLEQGALVTEFPPGTGPRPWHFPARNRIVSGLSVAVVVVEAGLSSGALITAGFALDQGREVYACTTGPENPAGAGVREMLRDGAKLVVNAEDAAAEIAGLAVDQGFATAQPRAMPARGREVMLEGARKKVFEAVGDGVSTDEVGRSSGLDPATVAAVLGELELEGLLVLQDGRWYRDE